MVLCIKGVNMVKEIVMDPDDIIEYVRNNVKNRAEAVALYLKKLLKEDPNSSLLGELLL